MELKKIIGELQNYQPQVICEVPEPTYIQTHKMIKPNQSKFFHGCLYVGYVSDLPAVLDTETVSNLICITNTPLPERYYHYKNVNLILIDYGINQYDVLNQIADIMIDEAKLISDMKRLLDALYSDLGLQHMVDVAYEAFGNPIFVNDIAYKILAMSHNAVFKDPTLEAEKKLGYIHEANVSALKRDRLLERSIDSDYPIYSKRVENAEGWLFIAIKIHNITVGQVGLVENNRAFRTFDYELLERFSKLVALEMEKNDFYKDGKGVMFNYLLVDLLSGNMQNLKAITQRMSYLNWKVFQFFQVLVIFDQKAGPLTSKTQNIGQQLHLTLPDCRWTIYETKVVAVFSRQQEEILTPNEKQLLNNFLLNNNLSAGLSDPFTDILQIQKSFAQAVKAGELGNRICKEQRLHFYTDYVISHMGEIIAERHDLKDFCHPILSILQQYDIENKSLLLVTLESYLRYVDDPVQAASCLHIHRNTLLYRINKIKELTKIDLNNGDERLKLQISLKFLKLQNSQL
jgi:sugar diacid utilization regulator